MENNQQHVQPVNQGETDFVAKTKKYRKKRHFFYVFIKKKGINLKIEK